MYYILIVRTNVPKTYYWWNKILLCCFSNYSLMSSAARISHFLSFSYYILHFLVNSTPFTEAAVCSSCINQQQLPRQVKSHQASPSHEKDISFLLFRKFFLPKLMSLQFMVYDIHTQSSNFVMRDYPMKLRKTTLKKKQLARKKKNANHPKSVLTSMIAMSQHHTTWSIKKRYLLSVPF